MDSETDSLGLGKVDLIKMDRNLILIYESGRISTAQPHLDPFTGSHELFYPAVFSEAIYYMTVSRSLSALISSSNSVSSFNIPMTACRSDN